MQGFLISEWFVGLLWNVPCGGISTILQADIKFESDLDHWNSEIFCGSKIPLDKLFDITLILFFEPRVFNEWDNLEKKNSEINCIQNSTHFGIS
jgi:hypothetical protein